MAEELFEAERIKMSVILSNVLATTKPSWRLPLKLCDAPLGKH